MIKRVVQLVLGLALVGMAIVLAARRSSSRPPLGPLVDPAHGIWMVARAAEPLGRRTIRNRIFEASVEAVVDRRGVPHIYAANELDAYRALGFMVARDRLFQLELQTRGAEGTLAQLVGASALPLDREIRKLGFGRMIERMRAAERDTPAAHSIAAYAAGINAWIDRMGPADLPLEYRLLGAKPRRWSEAHTYYLLARMALTLASDDASMIKTRAAARVGWPAADALYPVNSPIQEPIQANAVDQPRYDFVRLPPPGLPDSAARLLVEAVAAAQTSLGAFRGRDPAEALGSNNWAVSPSRSATGHALLAGDPHLELTLPSIWYQAHLVVPGRMDVAGVTLPGAPWIIIGYNREVAWSFTNSQADVTDFYVETVDDTIGPRRYRVDGGWRDLDFRVETYKDPTGQVVAVDTFRFTHRGPLWKAGPRWVSMAWTVYQGKSSGPEFVALPGVRSVSDFLEATKSYAVPPQNMIAADRAGTIAIRSTGRYPVRPGDGRGDLIRDGATSSSDWTGSLPLELYPFSLNPARGFLSSANQQPVDPLVNPRFYGANWYSPWRALRINALLRADPLVTVDAMRLYQTDPGSARADAFVPILLGSLSDTARVARAPEQVREARKLLAEWDRRYDRDNRRAVLFEAVMGELVKATWDELMPDDSAAASPDFRRPADAVLLELASDSASSWWDRRSTPAVVERRDDLIELALTQGLAGVKAMHGDLAEEHWRWSVVHTVNIYHLTRLRSLSALGLVVDGGPSTLSPSSDGGTSGASWRMVVELGDQVQVWGTYPGGQSGNPASAHYLDFLPTWLAGRLDSLVTPSTADGFAAGAAESRVRFEGER